MYTRQFLRISRRHYEDSCAAKPLMALATCVALSSWLAACGGGSASDTASTTGPAVTVSPPTTGTTGASSPGTGSTSAGAGGGGTTTPPSTTTPSAQVDPGPYWAQATPSAIASFDTAPSDAVSSWAFYGGTEFPGAAGSLAQGAGVSGFAADLQYDFSCGSTPWTPLGTRQCGRYVAMNYTLANRITPSANDTPTIALDVRNTSATAQPALRVVDSTNQTLQFPLNARPLENASGANWTHLLARIGSATIYWGGANDGQLHAPVKALSIMASNAAPQAPAGTLEVDNIAYMPSADTTFTLKTNAPMSSSPVAPTYVGHLGVAWHGPHGYTAVDKAKAVGITVIRTDLTWAGVERTNGVFDFSAYDAVTAQMAQRGVKILWILCYGNPLHGGVAPTSQADQAAFTTFASKAAAHFKGTNVYGYEIWNEPNLTKGLDATSYSTLFKQAQAAIKAADPTAVVVTGGVSDTAFDYLTTMLRTGNLSTANALALHPYRPTAPETFVAELSMLKQMAQATQGLATPVDIWDSEWGYSAYSDIGPTSIYGDGHDPRAQRRQAVLNLRKVLSQMAANMPLHVLYDLVDDGTDPLNREHNFGLLGSDLGIKPAMVAMQSLYSAQSGRTFKGMQPNVPPGLHVLRWDGSSDHCFVIWSDAVGSTATITLPSTAQPPTLWDGSSPAMVGTAAPLQFTLQEADGPVFVVTP